MGKNKTSGWSGAVQNFTALANSVTVSPNGLADECIRCAQIFEQFTHPKEHKLPIIPLDVVKMSHGIVILTVVKIGMGFSGRIGGGLIVGRLPDGRWSAPSAVALAGAGYGLQIGASLTDLVFVLNTPNALHSFSQKGGLTLGGQFGVAVGPGTAAEAQSAINSKGLTSIYTYSKTQGLFAGLSLEGSGFITRSDFNASFYGPNVKPSDLLTGAIAPPAAADSLYRALVGMYPAVLPHHQESHKQNQTPAYAPAATSSVAPSDTKLQPAPTVVPHTVDHEEHVKALYDFVPQREEDLGFKKGEIITVLQKIGDVNSWWYGQIGDRRGHFPANYCQPVEPELPPSYTPSFEGKGSGSGLAPTTTFHAMIPEADVKVDLKPASTGNSYKENIEPASVTPITPIDSITPSLPPVSITGDPATRVAQHRVIGDHNAHLAGSASGEKHEELLHKALESYKAGLAIAELELNPADPARLGVAFSLALLYFYSIKDKKQAMNVLDVALEKAEKIDLQTLPFNQRSEASLNIELMAGKKQLWQAEMNE